MSETKANTVDLAPDPDFPKAPPLQDRIEIAKARISNGWAATMRIPAEDCDPDVVLMRCQAELQALRAALATATLSRDHWKARAEGSEANLALISQVAGGFGEAIRRKLDPAALAVAFLAGGKASEAGS